MNPLQNMKAERLQHAVARVQAFLQPVVAFTSGHKVYEPEETDISAGASLKRDLFKLASTAVAQAQRVRTGSPAELVTFDASLIDQIAAVIDPTEQPEFRDFAMAVEGLIGELNVSPQEP